VHALIYHLGITTNWTAPEVFFQFLQRNADYDPAGVAIACGDECVSHGELKFQVESVARGLRDLGVGRGDRVALFLENSPRYIVSFFAVAACRGTNVPLNIELKEEEVRFYLNDAKVRCVIVDAARVELIQRAAAEVGHEIKIVVTDDENTGNVPFARLLQTRNTTRLPACCLDDDVVYIYTSGTTGRPKCAPRTVEQYWSETISVIDGIRLSRSDVIFCAIPLFHNLGAVHCMLAAAGSGAKLVMLKNPNPFVLRRREALRLLEAENVTDFPGVPYIFDHLASSSTPANLSAIRMCYSASAVLSEQTARTFFQKFDLPIRGHYGCTEVGAMTILLDDDPTQYSESVGVAFPGVQITIMDDAEHELPIGEIGEIVVSSRGMTRGYLGVDEQANSMFRHGKFFTGDLGRVDDVGRLYLMGRKKLIIDVAGHKVSPIEVEDVLAQHPAVRGSVVVGVADHRGDGQAVAAFVALNEPCESNELKQFCRERLANFKVPQLLQFISDVPRNALGKVVRRADELEKLVIDSVTRERDREAI